MVRLNSTVENDCLTDEVTIRKKMGPQSKMVPQSTWLVKSGMRTRGTHRGTHDKKKYSQKKNICVRQLATRRTRDTPSTSSFKTSDESFERLSVRLSNQNADTYTNDHAANERTENVKPADFAADRAGSRNIPVHDRRRRDSKVCVERKTVVRSRFASANVEASASVWRRPNRRKEKWAGRKYLHATLHRPREFAGRMTS